MPFFDGLPFHLDNSPACPSAIVTARALQLRDAHRNPHWEEGDALTFVIRMANENDWMVHVGPLGAYAVK